MSIKSHYTFISCKLDLYLHYNQSIAYIINIITIINAYAFYYHNLLQTLYIKKPQIIPRL